MFGCGVCWLVIWYLVVGVIGFGGLVCCWMFSFGL